MKKRDLKPAIAKMEVKNAAREAIKAEFLAKEKGKPLTTAERLERMERLLGLGK